MSDLIERLKGVEAALSSAQRNTYMCRLQWEQCQQALAAIPGIIAEAEGLQWKLIETVPDDVDTVLGYSPEGSIEGTSCVAEINYSEGNIRRGWWEAVDGNSFYPTHWMHLPKPPKEGTDHD